jgi:hypothetical protein
MRHSLTKNICPSCGGSLLGDLHTRRLGILKQKIMAQDFSESLNEDLLFDISFFILTEFFPFLHINKSTESDTDESSAAKGDADVSGDDLVAVEKSLDSEDFDSIRNQIREEAMKDLDEIDEGTDLKVARLKRIAKESPMLNKAGVRVRRSES